MSRISRFDLSELMEKIETMKQQGKSNRRIGRELNISEGYVRKLIKQYGGNRDITNDITDSNDIADSIADVIAKKVVNELTKKIANDLENKVLANVIKRLNDYK